MKQYDVIIIGAGPGGIYSAWEMAMKKPELKIAVFEKGRELEKRKCPINGDTVKNCVGCPSCAIMSGFGGAGAFSDGKYNITNEFGGTLHEYIGKKKAMELMRYVDDINMSHGGEGTRMYSTGDTKFKKICIQNNLHLLDASVRHLGTDVNYIVLEQLFAELKDRVDFFFNCAVEHVTKEGEGYGVHTSHESYFANSALFPLDEAAVSGWRPFVRRWIFQLKSNRVDIGVRVELPAVVFSDLTDELYESKIVYRTEKFEDLVRTFCMNPKGAVVAENTNGIVTVNGHSYENPELQTENTNFALLVAKHFSEPFKDSNGYGESIARLSNMLGGGVIVQRFGDLFGEEEVQKNVSERVLWYRALSATPEI